MAVVGWELAGTLLVACNCDYGCPCNVNGRPSTGKCEGGWTWHIGSGRWGTTRLDGLNFSIFANWPGAIHEGGGVAVGYLDQRADPAQRQAITELMCGRAGGPWAIFITTYELVGPRFALYEVEIAGERSYYRIGDAAELRIEPIRNPVSGQEVHPRLLLPEGLLTQDMGLFASALFRVQSDTVAYDHSGRYASLAEFASSGP
jgi:hypothetical protein